MITAVRENKYKTNKAKLPVHIHRGKKKSSAKAVYRNGGGGNFLSTDYYRCWSQIANYCRKVFGEWYRFDQEMIHKSTMTRFAWTHSTSTFDISGGKRGVFSLTLLEEMVRAIGLSSSEFLRHLLTEVRITLQQISFVYAIFIKARKLHNSFLNVLISRINFYFEHYGNS